MADSELRMVLHLIRFSQLVASFTAHVQLGNDLSVIKVCCYGHFCGAPPVVCFGELCVVIDSEALPC